MAITARLGSDARVPLIDLGRQHELIGPELDAAFRAIVGAGAFTLGEALTRFEEEFADCCGVSHCAGVANGTDALKLALLALGAGPGREVVTTAQSFFATAEAIVDTGAQPVFADVDPRTRCVSAEGIGAALTERTVAVAPVHLYGRPAPMREIRAVCDRAGVAVVEDAAQAHGASIDGRPVGSWGAAAAFSFYPTKNLGALGDGGAVVSDDPELIAAVRSLRHHGSAPDDANRHERLGGTSRLDNLQAAFLSVKLPWLELFNQQRGAAAAQYAELLRDAPVGLPAEDEGGGRQVHHLFVVEVEHRDEVLAFLRRRGIGAGVHYPTPMPLQEAFGGRFAAADYPAAVRLSARALSLPIFPGVTEDELGRVADLLMEGLADADR